MHETHAVEQLFKDALKLSEINKAKEVKEISIAVGHLTGFKEAFMKSHFQTLAKGSILEHTKLKFKELPAKEFYIENIDIEK
jgi:Zn finger protein HypA/HybF involved in hydrogenase expression